MLSVERGMFRILKFSMVSLAAFLILSAPVRGADEVPSVFTDVVARVIDGNTILLRSGIQVRLIGVRAPSPYDKAWNDRILRDLGLKKKTLGPDAERIKEFAKYLVEGKDVRVELDPGQAAFENKDREQRLFAYVWFTAPVFPEPPEWLVIDPEVSGTEFRYDALLNACLIRSGLAAMDTGWPFSYGGKFITLQSEARDKGRGFWEGEAGTAKEPSKSPGAEQKPAAQV